ncbi:MAG TPA: hypothetical protein VKV05_07015 [Terriglobales bacterium]|nr:hypothetical protein [Terriglobales bacterium]
MSRFLLFCTVFLGLAGNALAAAKVESIGPLTSAPFSDELRQAVADKGYRVTLDGGWVAEFWFAKELKTGKNATPGALYPELADGAFVGIVNLPQGMSDYRGDKIAPGIYTLRYQSLPQDGNHMGVAPNPDFLLASPAADDSQPDQSYPFQKRVALSAKSTKTNHPAVILLESPGSPATVSENESGEVVFNVAVPSAGGSEKLGIVVKGTAGQ